jgi:creatinase
VTPRGFARAEFEARVARAQTCMAEIGLGALLLTTEPECRYFTGFLTRFWESPSRPWFVVVPAKGAPVAVIPEIGAPLMAKTWITDIRTWPAPRPEDEGISLLADTLDALADGPVGLPSGPETHLRLGLDDLARLRDLTGWPLRDDAGITARLRAVKSPAEIALIRQCALIADVGGYAIRDAVREGTREIDVAMAGRDAMELEIARRFPDAEYRDTWVWFQSGLNTDGAHNPVTSRKLARGDILSLNTFPMVSGYYTALERTMFVGNVDAASLEIWQANVAAHEYGMSLLKPGISCAEVTQRINAFLEERDLLQFRTFGYGHSFGILSHYYGREAGLELREDIDTVLEPGMVISMEPMLTIPDGQPGAGGYREHDILIITDDGNDNITGYPYGPDFNVVG